MFIFSVQAWQVMYFAFQPCFMSTVSILLILDKVRNTALIGIYFMTIEENIRIYSRKITSEIQKVIFLLMRLITAAVLRVRVSSKD